MQVRAELEAFRAVLIPFLVLMVYMSRFWVGYQYVITNQNHSLEGRWEVAYQGLTDLHF